MGPGEKKRDTTKSEFMETRADTVRTETDSSKNEVSGLSWGLVGTVLWPVRMDSRTGG